MYGSKSVKFLAALFFITCCSAPAFAGDTIKFGVGGAHSGDLSGYGLPILNAAKIVAEQYNAKGGINGKKVEVLAQDDQCKPELATNAATKLISDGAEVVLGHTCGGPTKATLPLYKEAKIVLISASATPPMLTKSGDYPNFFRTIATDDQQAYLGAAFALEKLGAKRFAFLHDKDDYGKGYAEYAKEYVEKNGKGAEVVLFEGITPGAVDYSGIIQKVRNSKADVVIFGGYDPEASKLVTQMRKKQMKIPFVSDDGVKVDSFLKLAGQYSEGVYASGPRSFDELPLYREAVAAHKKAYGTDPGQFYFQAYSAALAILNAVEKAGTTDAAKVQEVLHTQYVETPIGKIRFDKNGDAEGVGFVMWEVKSGKFAEVK